ncbi:MAG: hypothetical protein COX79_01425 [Candidatus Levybacteria bacterium CG_4_10_14_0_2_um_filter_36_16]|nr:MAG: hypothetical protein AUK12_03275 [Candidatus Levybacteria bacterium CG2_30_37_29]PIR79112.1 MAG: hypothetical protein COU26_02915 [Candidatus Levybacteria bacterium CG10_big_fil_rev_8_21_14_0_10_36_30]PIZ97621.1 MAG: hypothetical protein COX79_01425 [Candidatus Levybacteria bacterium CG_4_10_14_0_2_um_filter_36_16]PJA90257.1 MAG: hypothetical protein CO136_02695 [Candidatus Levybacteria bacterium CG_4_9_14_3_um_filter_36_7]
MAPQIGTNKPVPHRLFKHFKKFCLDKEFFIWYTKTERFRMKKILYVFIFTLALLTQFSFPAFAQYSPTKPILLPSELTIEKDYFAAGNSVTLNGSVNGDAYLAGKTVVVNGAVNGDLLATGATITVKGDVKGNIRAIGGNVIITSKVGGNITLVAQNVKITDPADITGSLVAIAEKLEVKSPIGKGVHLVVANATFENSVSQDIRGAVGTLSFGKNAKVGGSVIYWSNNKATISKDAAITGKIEKHSPPPEIEKAKISINKSLTAFLLWSKIVGFLALLIVGLLLIYFMPVYTEKTAALVWGSPGRTFIVGLVAIIITPILFVLFFATILGIPLAFLTLIFFFLLLSYSKILAAMAIGKRVAPYLGKKISLAWMYVLGVVIFSLLSYVPVVGWIVNTVLGLMAMGAFLVSEKDYYQKMRSKKQI